MEEQAAAVNPRWRKSSYSGNGGTACIEAGHVPGAVLVRDTTQHGNGPVLRVTPAGWTRLLHTVAGVALD
jgi:Domain of unknown function (DUF397)